MQTALKQLGTVPLRYPQRVQSLTLRVAPSSSQIQKSTPRY